MVKGVCRFVLSEKEGPHDGSRGALVPGGWPGKTGQRWGRPERSTRVEGRDPLEGSVSSIREGVLCAFGSANGTWWCAGPQGPGKALRRSSELARTEAQRREGPAGRGRDPGPDAASASRSDVSLGGGPRSDIPCSVALDLGGLESMTSNATEHGDYRTALLLAVEPRGVVGWEPVGRLDILMPGFASGTGQTV